MESLAILCSINYIYALQAECMASYCLCELLWWNCCVHIINNTTIFLEKYLTFYYYLCSIRSRMSFPKKPFQMQTSTILQINNLYTWYFKWKQSLLKSLQQNCILCLYIRKYVYVNQKFKDTWMSFYKTSVAYLQSLKKERFQIMG